jgi:hypothetical protein
VDKVENVQNVERYKERKDGTKDRYRKKEQGRKQTMKETQ